MKKLLYAVVVLLLVACGAPKDVTVRMHTTAGIIDLCLYDETPKHRDNFIRLVKVLKNLISVICYTLRV